MIILNVIKSIIIAIVLKNENCSLTYQYLRLFQLLSGIIFTVKGFNVVLCVSKQKIISCIHFSFIVLVVT